MLIIAVALASSDAAAQPLTLDHEQVVTHAVPGATAAFSLDPSRVSASARDGLVTIVGRGPGSTNVIVIAGDDTVSLPVLVREPAALPHPGLRNGAVNGAGAGHYEARYGSNPGILQGNLFLSRRDGDRTAELSLGGAVPIGRDLNSRLSLPLASFTLRTPGREITLLDRVVSTSPLTVSRSNVRGLHLRQGPWHLTGGYSFFSSFEHVLLPTDKQAVAGVGYRHQLRKGTILTPHLYYFGPRSQDGQGGALGTVYFQTRTASDVAFAAELAAGPSVGGALEIEADRPNRRAWLKLRVAPQELPSLTTDQQSGRQFEGGWVSQGKKSTLNATVSSRGYHVGDSYQASTVASLDLQRRFTPHWAVHGGSAFSLFDNGSESAATTSADTTAGRNVHHLTLPVGASFSGRNVGLSLDYQFSRETTRDLGGHLVRGNISGNAGGYRFLAFGERQTQAPTARQIFADVPALQPILDRLGLSASTPQQLADLLRTNAELSAYGYANGLRIDVTPVRTRVGANGSWSGSGRRRPQVFVNTFANWDQSVDRSSFSAVHSLTYSQALHAATDLFVSWSAVCHERFLSTASCQPVLFASLRRSLSEGFPLLTTRRGHIDGVVFKDDERRGMHTPGAEPLAGVEVTLDNVRHTRTDGSGRFRFDDVPYGRHRVEARYASEHPTYFTTPSPAEVDTGGSVSFGIARARSSLRGVIRTDAAIAVPGVHVHIAGAGHRTTVRTSDDGTFVAEGLAAGDYVVEIDPGSVPAGYPLDHLEAKRVHVERTAPGRVAFVLRPYRTVAGKARLFNHQTGEYVPLAHAPVELRPLGRQALTDRNGQYTFRDVPAGGYTVVAKHDAREYLSNVAVPTGPAYVKDVDVAVLPGTPAPGRAASASAPKGAVADQTTQPSGARVEGPAATNSVFTVQVAEATSARYALDMIKELKGAGHAAYLVEARNGPYHVRVGQYPSLAEASRSARRLEKALGWKMSVTTATSILFAR